MIGQVLASLGLCALGVLLIRTRRGAHAFYSQSWRGGGDAADSWFATVVGPATMAAIQGLLGVLAILAGLAILLARL